jgi:hypothetical protein
MIPLLSLEELNSAIPDSSFKTLSATDISNMSISGTLLSDAYSMDFINSSLWTPKCRVISGTLDDYGIIGGVLIKNNIPCATTTTIESPVEVFCYVSGNQIAVDWQAVSEATCGPPTSINVSIEFYWGLKKQDAPTCGEDNVNWSDGRGDSDGPYVNPDAVVCVAVSGDILSNFNLYWNDEFVGEIPVIPENFLQGAVYLGSQQGGLSLNSYCSNLPPTSGSDIYITGGSGFIDEQVDWNFYVGGTLFSTGGYINGLYGVIAEGFFGGVVDGLSVSGFVSGASSSGQSNFCQTLPQYTFSSLLLNKGINKVDFRNIEGATGDLEITIFQKSGLQLVSPKTLVSTGFSSTGQDLSFYCPIVESLPTGYSYLYEFDPVFNIDTGNLNAIYSGSGVHLKRDVKFVFDLQDQIGSTITSDSQFVENPLLGDMSFDITDRCGNVIAENYFSGKYTRSFTITETENENIFGTYQKDFGVRIKVPNSFDGSTFTGVFCAFGNIPNIIDIRPEFIEFSGTQQVTDALNVNLRLQNNPRFTQMDRYDVYAFTESGVQLPPSTSRDPQNQAGYLLSQSTATELDTYRLRITRQSLDYNVPYYFTIVPYSTMGSGKSAQVGPVTFVQPQTNLEFSSISVNQVNIVFGDSFARSFYQTGAINNQGLIYVLETGDFSTASYLVEMKCGDGIRRSSELKTVVNDGDALLLENPINNTGASAVEYYVSTISGTGWGLYAENANGYSTYKIHGTTI